MVFDADIGLANIDVLMGVSAKYNLYHLLKKKKRSGKLSREVHMICNSLQVVLDLMI